MYVGKHDWCMNVYMYILTSIFIEGEMDEYVGMYMCMYACRQTCTNLYMCIYMYVDIHK